MRIGLTYDLKDDYLALGFSEHAVAEFDSTVTIDAIAGALASLGHSVDRIGHVRALAARLVAGDRWDLVFNIAEGVAGFGRESQYARSAAVKHRSRKRSPCRASPRTSSSGRPAGGTRCSSASRSSEPMASRSLAASSYASASLARSIRSRSTVTALRDRLVGAYPVVKPFRMASVALNLPEERRVAQADAGASRPSGWRCESADGTEVALIRKDGLFVPKSLQKLNPEYLLGK